LGGALCAGALGLDGYTTHALNSDHVALFVTGENAEREFR
jgi:hypothetical protein